MPTTAPSTLRYQISMEDPGRHRFHVEITWSGPHPMPLHWALPVWTPGSYLVREFAKNVSQVRAHHAGHPVRVDKVGKAEWSLVPDDGSASTWQLAYDVYAFELSVRSSYLDTTRGYFNGANVFLYPQTDVPYMIELEVVPFPGWDVATALERSAAPGFVFTAADYDTLVDSPVECGTFRRESFEMNGVRHELILTGFDRTNLSNLLRDLPRILEAAHAVFGGLLPYTRYVFLVAGVPDQGGGLEHRSSASIIFDPLQLDNPEQYPKILALFAHEYFHLWNVKRLRPQNLGPFDYQHEVYTHLLWVLEGWTDYYAWLLLARSGTVTPDIVLQHFAESLRILDMTPGHKVQSVAEASWDAWIKFYRPDGNTPNITVSYYLKGALVALFMDLSLRHATNGRGSLDTVLQTLWEQYGDHGYPENAVDHALEEVGGPIVRTWLSRWVYGTDDLETDLWPEFGLALKKEWKNPRMTPAFTGLIVERSETDRVKIKSVLQGSPGEAAGLAPGDEWIAWDQVRLRFQDLDTRLAHCVPGRPVTVTIFRHQRLQSYTLIPEAPKPDKWALEPEAQSTEKARQQFRDWLGAPLP